MKKLYRYKVDYGRMGKIEGQFECDESELPQILNKDLYLGEVLGKHSEVIINLSESDLEVVTDNQEFLNMAHSLKINLNGPFCPFDYLET